MTSSLLILMLPNCSDSFCAVGKTKGREVTINQNHKGTGSVFIAKLLVDLDIEKLFCDSCVTILFTIT